jgi:radical SAM-linked protein
MLGDKFRFRFRKSGPLRLLSHLDLVRCLERVARRAEVRLKMTAGFHPLPRMIFALSLPLGAEGHREIVELEVAEPMDDQDVLQRLQAQCPRGFDFESVTVLPMKAGAVPRRVVYTLPVPTERLASANTRIAEVMSQDQVWVSRVKPKPRRINIKPYIRNMTIRDNNLSLDLWVTNNGSARADELLNMLNLNDLLEAGAILSRSELQVHDETPASELDAPPTAAPETAPLASTPAMSAEDDRPNAPKWGLSPNGPVVE